MRFIVFLFLVSNVIVLYAKDYDIRDFGAKSDSLVVNTKAIQRAIDVCSAEGGGRVCVSGGNFITGTIIMKSGVTLRIEGSSKLIASINIKDYHSDVYKNMYRREPHMDRCLIFAHGVNNIGFEGNGTIDGCGNSFPTKGDSLGYRPMLIRLLECNHIRMRDLNLINPAAWTSAWLYCNDISVDGVNIHARANWNGDGLDFDGCTNVRVTNCAFDTSDDSICLQTSRKNCPCKNVVVTNCIFSSHWAGVRIGLLSRSNFENVIISNCVFHDMNDSGLKIQMDEGASMRNMQFSDLVMVNVPRPIFMTLCGLRSYVDGEEDYPKVGTIESIRFNNFHIDNSAIDKNSAIMITGVPENYIRDISLSNISMIVSGGGTKEDANVILNEFTREFFESLDHYITPEYFVMGGVVPASGIFLRHIDGIDINGFKLKTITSDHRKDIIKIDVKNLIYKQ